MFRSARLKLTSWYLLIIMAISLIFSAAYYRVLVQEINRGLRIERYRIERPDQLFPYPPPRYPVIVDTQLLEEIKERIKLNLFILNLGIFTVSGLAGYFLAGRTLRPIEDMVDEQKRFVADASHEFRTPLTAMKTELEVALRDKKRSEKDTLPLLKSFLEEINKMQSLANNLLNLTSYQNLNSNLSFESIALKDIIVQSVKNVSAQAKKKSIKIETDATNINLEGNKVSLIELFTILLDNAVKFSHTDNKILVRISTVKEQAVVIVEDFGIGIKDSDLPHIFKRFYRADNSRNKGEIDGFGIGLSIAKNITELHHGTISVRSTNGKGSIFTVKLPQYQK